MCDQLTVNRIDDLAEPCCRGRRTDAKVCFLVAARLGEHAGAIVLPEFISNRCTDVGLVADDDADVVSTDSHRQ